LAVALIAASLFGLKSAGNGHLCDRCGARHDGDVFL
jgi:hypothetical protein